MISSRLGELLCHYRVYYSFQNSLLFIFYVLGHRYYRYPLCYELWIAKVFLLLHCSNQIRKMRNQSKVSGPELNHDYISYSDIKIRYRWNRGSGPLISLDHVRIRRPISSSCFVPSCSIGIHRYSFLPPRKVHSESQELIFLLIFSFLFVMVMQCKRSRKSGCFWWWFFFMMWNWWKPDI